MLFTAMKKHAKHYTFLFLKNLSRDFSDCMNIQNTGRAAILVRMKLPTFTTFHALLMFVALSVSMKLIYWNSGLKYQFQMEFTPLFCGTQMLLIPCTAHLWQQVQNDTQGCTNPGCRVTIETKFCMVVPNTRRSLVWNWLQITLLASRISEVAPRFFVKICALLNLHHTWDTVSVILFTILSIFLQASSRFFSCMVYGIQSNQKHSMQVSPKVKKSRHLAHSS